MRFSGFAAATLVALVATAASAQTADNRQPPGTPTATVISIESLTEPAPGAATPPAAVPVAASSSMTYQVGNATLTSTMVTNGPVADTPENRSRYGQPMSRAGKRSLAKGN